MTKPLPKRLRLTTRHYTFEPRWSFILTTLVLLAFFLKLGFWQLDRAEEKNRLMQSYESGFNTNPAALNALPDDPGEWSYLPIVATGTYDNTHNILLDNKIYNHLVGYEVLTPMRIQGESRLILVNRGWVAAPRQREILPEIPEATTEHTFTGVIYIPPKKPFTLEKGNTEEEIMWPLRMQVLDLSKIEKALNAPVFPFVVQLDPDQENGFIRDWQPINMVPEKHMGYAVQWFAFAMVLMIIFISLNVKRKK